jgi:tRNA threonylcarbamoyladenosine biosynthesis protein TsaB
MSGYTLALETTQNGFSLAVVGDGILIASYHNPATHQAANLIPTLKQVLWDNEVSLSQIARIGVCTGPGSFTGIRLGMSTASGLALGLNIPCVGVDSIYAHAWQANHHNPRGLPVVVLLDARLEHFFGGVFDADNHALRPAGLVHRHAVHSLIPRGGFLGVGDGWALKPHLVDLAAPELIPSQLTATAIAHIAHQQSVIPHQLPLPTYMKDSYAKIAA